MNIVIAIVLLGVLVAIHEFGHFIVAKISGMYVEKFSIGVGPKIASFKGKETEYVFSVIPAGGFVSVRGISVEGEEYLDYSDPRLFQNRPILHRVLFTIAGPFMNFLFAFVVLMCFYLSLGVETPKMDSPAIIEAVSENSPASKAGLKQDDKILSIDNKKIQSWVDVDNAMKAYQSGNMQMTILRQGKEIETSLKPLYNKDAERYTMGVTKRLETVHENLDVKEAMQQSTYITLRMSTMILNAVGDLVTRKTAINDEEGGLSGPVGIVKVIDQSLNQGVWQVVSLLAVFSINFGLLNMLPIPALDGSRFLFLLIEGIRGIPVSPDKESIVNFIGFIGLMILMIYVTYNDILRVIQ